MWVDTARSVSRPGGPSAYEARERSEGGARATRGGRGGSFPVGFSGGLPIGFPVERPDIPPPVRCRITRRRRTD